jgi:pimeloyl-ACP methyl ester carboxylesterase
MQESTIAVRGQELRMMDAGTGPSILFLHGAGGLNWYPLLEILSQEWRVIAPEHPGWGRSSIPTWLATVGDLAFFYLDIIEAIGLEHVHLVGHSMGGWTAAELAIRNTTRLESLTLMAPAGVASQEVPFGDIFAWSAEDHARRAFHDQRFAKERIRALPTADLAVMRQNRAAAAHLGANPLLTNPQLRHWLHRIDLPTLLVWGVEDQICPFACHRAYLAEIPNAELFALPESGHALHTERPREVAARLAAFFRGSG